MNRSRTLLLRACAGRSTPLLLPSLSSRNILIGEHRATARIRLVDDDSGASCSVRIGSSRVGFGFGIAGRGTAGSYRLGRFARSLGERRPKHSRGIVALDRSRRSCLHRWLHRAVVLQRFEREMRFRPVTEAFDVDIVRFGHSSPRRRGAGLQHGEQLLRIRRVCCFSHLTRQPRSGLDHTLLRRPVRGHRCRDRRSQAGMSATSCCAVPEDGASVDGWGAVAPLSAAIMADRSEAAEVSTCTPSTTARRVILAIVGGAAVALAALAHAIRRKAQRIAFRRFARTRRLVERIAERRVFTRGGRPARTWRPHAGGRRRRVRVPIPVLRSLR